MIPVRKRSVRPEPALAVRKCARLGQPKGGGRENLEEMLLAAGFKPLAAKDIRGRPAVIDLGQGVYYG